MTKKWKKKKMRNNRFSGAERFMMKPTENGPTELLSITKNGKEKE
jgi:hypothetical protein